MKSAIYMDGKRFIETEFKTEEDFERVVKEHSKTLFGAKTIFSDLKNKIDSRTLGSSVPDGISTILAYQGRLPHSIWRSK